MNNRKIILNLLALGGLALCSVTQAVVPPPDGGYPGGNTAEGQSALLSLTSGTFNTAVGVFSLLSNTEGNFDTAIGAGGLLANTAGGDENTATGAGALLSNTIGSGNTADGAFALFSNIDGSSNTAIGDNALFSNTSGGGNTAMGAFALRLNTSNANTAVGTEALANNTTGGSNTATGTFALRNTTVGHDNTATGLQVLLNNTTGSFNTAVGSDALSGNISGIRNTAVGAFALSSSTGDLNTALGFNAGLGVTTASNAICIGANVAGADVPDSCFIGNIYQKQVGNDSLPVVVDSSGKLGTSVSSSRFKHDIKPMDKTSEAILALKPVTFHYKTDNANTPQFGLIAEEVAEVNPDLAVRDKEGKPYTVRYDAVNAMLLNEFLKEHRKVEELEATVARQEKDFRSASAQQQKRMELLTKKLEEQTAQIEKVNAEIQISRPALKTVLNKP